MRSLLKYISVLCILLMPFFSQAQFLGGNGNGYGADIMQASTLNVQDFYCSGGNNDGYEMEAIESQINEQYFYCAGGIGDGYDANASINSPMIEQEFYCSGGNGDGYHMVAAETLINIQNFYCSGGSGDGYDMVPTGVVTQIDQSLYCSGGIGDGFARDEISSSINDQELYCMGGEDDGYSMESSGIITQVDQSLYCSGGDDDGYDFGSVSSSMNIQYIYCEGGNGDGYGTVSRSTTINVQNLYCFGGNGDGYDLGIYQGSIFGLAIFAYGGNGDGFSMANYSGSIFGPSIFCLGGNGDGYGLAIGSSVPLGVGIWTGLTNTAWNTNTNWAHDIVPNISHHVTIPAGCPNYPIVGAAIGIDTTLGSIQCHALDILAGSSIEHSGGLFVNGLMTVSGNYIATLIANNSHQIHKRGEINIPAGGSMIVGNQTTSSIGTDLVIYDRGVLSIDGGYLGIDDKLWLQSGGTFTMTAGEIFVNKLGEGSALGASYNPGFFYVEAGAFGGISGGVFKICGNDNNVSPHISPYSMVINEPDFDFTGTSTLRVQHGVVANHYNTSIEVVDGVVFQNIIIDKASRSVFLRGNTSINGDLTIEPDCTLEIESGYTITNGP